MGKEIVGSNKILFATDYPSCLKEDSYNNLIKLFEENDSFYK
ncbi:MAG: amidohydrolase [Clostridium sp.]|nr:MAG: amidohydrolase [Clostridium sp.]